MATRYTVELRDGNGLDDLTHNLNRLLPRAVRLFGKFRKNKGNLAIKQFTFEVDPEGLLAELIEAKLDILCGPDTTYQRPKVSVRRVDLEADAPAETDTVDLAGLSFRDLRTLAKERGLSLKSPSKKKLLEALSAL